MYLQKCLKNTNIEIKMIILVKSPAERLEDLYMCEHILCSMFWSGALDTTTQN